MSIGLKVLTLLGLLLLQHKALARMQCVNRNTVHVDTTWMTSYLYYENVVVPAGSAPVGHVNFTTHIEVNNFTMTCDLTGTDISYLETPNSGDVSWRNCSDPKSPDIQTRVRFSWQAWRSNFYAPAGILEIYQEWLCDGGFKANPDDL